MGTCLFAKALLSKGCVYLLIKNLLPSSGRCFIVYFAVVFRWKVVASSPDGVIFFNLPKPSSRIIRLGSIQPLKGMSACNLPEGLRAAGA
jgi:hypothetical protein